MKKITHTEGDVLFLEMLKPNTGKFPISRTESGMICLIKSNPEKKKPYFEYGSIWTCEVIEVHEKKLIVQPLQMEVSATENERLMKEKIDSLKKEKPQRREKPQRNYRYKRADEIIHERNESK